MIVGSWDTMVLRHDICSVPIFLHLPVILLLQVLYHTPHILYPEAATCLFLQTGIYSNLSCPNLTYHFFLAFYQYMYHLDFDSLPVTALCTTIPRVFPKTPLPPWDSHP